MVKKITAVIAGIISGMIVTFLIQKLGHILYPLPQNVDPNKIETMVEYVSNAPFMALFFVIISYAVCALVVGFVSTKIANDGKGIYAIIGTVFFLLASIYNMYQLPTPLWFWILGILVWGLAYVGYKLAFRKSNV